MTALPGTPAIQNAIPMPYFGTTPFAAPGLGLIGGAVMGMLGAVWMLRRARQAAAAGEGNGLQLDGPALLDRSLRPHAPGEGYDVAELGLQRSGPAAPGQQLPGQRALWCHAPGRGARRLGNHRGARDGQPAAERAGDGVRFVLRPR